eukprot:8902761-Alexandrium_andersonii.AAC.1
MTRCAVCASLPAASDGARVMQTTAPHWPRQTSEIFAKDLNASGVPSTGLPRYRACHGRTQGRAPDGPASLGWAMVL